MLRGRVWGEEGQGEWIPLFFGSFFFFNLIHSRGLGEGFHYSSSFSWDWREVFFLGQCAKEGFPKHEKPHTISFLFPSLFFFFFFSRRRKGWVATCGISHPLKSIYLFYEARQTHKFWVVGQQCVFPYPRYFFFFFFFKADIFFFLV